METLHQIEIISNNYTILHGPSGKLKELDAPYGSA